MLRGCDAEVLSLNDFPKVPEIEEDGRTFFDNALKKARVVSEITGMPALADDSGLEVDALNGEPGIYSSRYSGPGATDESNNRKLLENLSGLPPEQRGARFRCVLVFYRPDGTFDSFEGFWRGRIVFEPRGTLGFGYDPLFMDTERQLTAAELPPEIKNRVSHRGQALEKFRQWLEQARSKE